MTSELSVKIIPIIRMDCPTCIPVLEKEVTRLDGVDEVRGNYLNKTLKVTYNTNIVQLTDIEATIERLGYRIAYKKYPGAISKLRSLLRGKKTNEVFSLTDIDFSGKVLHASTPVVVLFSSPNCPICIVFKKQFIEIAAKVEGNADLYEMDIASTETWREYDILSVPTVLVFKDGLLSDRFTALPRSDDITRALLKLM